MNYKIKMRKVNTFIFDVDGVLTNGEVILFKNEIVRVLNSRDGYAIQHAAKEGYRILIITGGSSEEVKTRLLGLGATEVCLKSSNKLEVYESLKLKYDFTDEEALYMGDDIPDLEVMGLAGLACCPHDAAPEIRAISDYVSPFAGGTGCVRDVLEQAMKLKGLWMNDLAHAW